MPQDPNCDGTLGYTAGKHTTGHPQCHDLVYGPLFYPQTAERPVTAETEVQTEVVRSFGWILGIVASVYVVWRITENTLKSLYTKDTILEFAWVFSAMWDLIFVLVVMSMMCIWRVNEHSEMLAYSCQIGAEDESLSEEARLAYLVKIDCSNS